MNIMTANEAISIVAQMVAETKKPARVRLMQLAIKVGKLSDDAKDVYRNQLIADGAA